MEQQTFHTATADISRNLAHLKSVHPQLMQGFGGLAHAATVTGALDEKFKELIALALGVAVRCDGCIGFHTRSLVRLGATQAEIAEAIGVAVYMGGGPSLMYAAHAMQAWKEFSPVATEV